MKKPVCVACGLTMYPEENGICAMEMKDKEKTEPYRIWSTDKWKCPGCGIEVLSGFGDRASYPGTEEYERREMNFDMNFY